MDTPTLITGWRTAAGLSRMELAGKLGAHVSSISGWERGRPCSAETVAAIGLACGVAPLARAVAVLDAAGEEQGAAVVRAVLGGLEVSRG